MAFNKVGELATPSVQTVSSVMAELDHKEVNERFSKFAQQLKRIAPKADDFLYFTAVMITAAEAAALNADGTPKKRADGSAVEVGWDVDDKTGSWKWKTNDPGIQAYANANGDIFPEKCLLEAYKKWNGKVLAQDHNASSMDGVRGLILDTYYDRKHKQVIGLACIDRVNFPQLARGIETGVNSNVSMGTAVGKAICYDCGQVARNEREFCNHMRTKTAKEINTELNPLELSIVVVPADPLARVRTVLAAANTLRKDFEKIASDEHPSFSKLKSLEEDFLKMSDRLIELKASLEKEEVNKSAINSAISAKDNVDDTNMSAVASANTHNYVFEKELQRLRGSLDVQLNEINKKLATLSQIINEEMMSNPKDMNKAGYYHGTVDPTPGKTQYEVDPLNDEIRGNFTRSWGEDDLSSKDVNSINGKDLDLKRKVNRLYPAGVESRAARRAEALKVAKEKLQNKKEAYMNGTTEPGDKKFVSEKYKNERDTTIGDLGGPTGLAPSPSSADEKDELKRKQKLNRASENLRAKFVRVAGKDGAQDRGRSGWQVFRGDELVLTASVNEISAGNVDKLYGMIATAEFGKSILQNINSIGIEKAASVYKTAQLAGPGAPPADMPPPPAPDMGAPPDMGAAPDMGAPEVDPGSAGDPKEVAVALATEVRDRSSDLLEAVRVLTGDQAEMGELDALPKAASLAPLYKMKRSLANTLISGLKRAVADLQEHEDELKLVTEIAGQGLIQDAQKTVVEEAFVDARAALNDTRKIMASFVSYVRGSEKLEKKAQAMQGQPAPLNPQPLPPGTEPTHPSPTGAAVPQTGHAEDQDSDDPVHEDGNVADDDDDCEDDNSADNGNDEGDEENHGDDGDDENHGDDEDEDDHNAVMVDIDPSSLQNKHVEIKAASDGALLTSKAGRAQLRAKLAAKALEFDPILDEAHKWVDYTQVGGGELSRVETGEEHQNAWLGVALEGTPKVLAPKIKREAERLNELIVSGKVKVAELDTLVSKGLDAEVKKYWEQYYGDSKEGKAYVAELLKEHAKAEVDQEKQVMKVKLARAYDLANQMVARGMLNSENVSNYVENDILSWNDEGFESMKRIVNRTAMNKSAGIIPQVGVNEGIQQIHAVESLADQLDQAFSGMRHRRS